MEWQLMPIADWPITNPFFFEALFIGDCVPFDTIKLIDQIKTGLFAAPFTCHKYNGRIIWPFTVQHTHNPFVGIHMIHGIFLLSCTLWFNLQRLLSFALLKMEKRKLLSF
jgi:hypothetical protein